MREDSEADDARVRDADVPGPGPLTEISLERTPCFGSCPVDKVVLRPDGTATYIGRRFVERVVNYADAGPVALWGIAS